jgi:serine-type D-Ala-D-Ala carboxypeptidase (penicillin-binding protein 5/6)
VISRSFCIRALTAWTISVTAVGVFSIVTTSKTSAPRSVQVKGATTTQVLTIPAAFPKRSSTVADPFINVRHYALYHAESGSLLVGNDTDTKVPIASTTKLMTLALSMKYAQLDQTVTIERGTALQVGSLLGVFQGEQYTVEQLLYGLMLVSGNDTAYALAGHIGGILSSADLPETERVARFVQEMNNYAGQLGMTNTQFKDPAGLEDEGYSTPRDLAKLASVLVTNPLARKLSQTNTISFTDVSGRNPHQLQNSNRLVVENPYSGGVTLGKTGFTPAAGHCLVTASTVNGMTLIAVTLSSYVDTRAANAEETKKLLDWGFANYSITP